MTLVSPISISGVASVMHVRVDVDENDAWRIKEDAPAEASVRGNPALRTGLRYVRVEPFVVPKRSLTGDSSERVDTRVLQVIYSFDPAELNVKVGQQVDVFVEAPAVGG
jgi:HlyD family secretion protein